MAYVSGRGRGKVRAPRRGLTKDDVDQDETWSILDNAFRGIHEKNSSKLSFEELFRNAYKLVLKKKGEFLFEKVKNLEIELLDNTVKTDVVNHASPCLVYADSGDTVSPEKKAAGEKFLESLKTAYQDYQMCMSMITDVLMYMDRISTAEGRRPSIYVIAMGLFRQRVLDAVVTQELAARVLQLLENVILDMIALERSGEMIERPLVRACCRMLEGLYETVAEDESTRLYVTSFEPRFLEASREYYRNEGRILVQDADAHTFCSQAKRRLKEELDRCAQTLSSATEPKIRAVVEQELIAKNIESIIDLSGTGVRNMLDNDKIDDLSNMYDLVKSIDKTLGPLKSAVHKRVLELGKDVNEHSENSAKVRQETKQEKTPGEKPVPERQVNQQTAAAIQWVEEVLKLKKKYDFIWEQAFSCDTYMEKALERSFQDFINANARAAEYVSLFLDEHLKKNMKGKTEQEIDEALQSGVTLTQYLADKDVLETYYHKHMAKRLLQKKSVSRDIERLMLSRLKTKLGNQFTQKMEGLLKDTDVSETLNKNYKDYLVKLDNKHKLDVDIETNVLTTTVWPIKVPEGDNKGCIYPADVEESRQAFEKFYLNKHTGRKLTWMANLGDATLRATYTKQGKSRRYEINAPTYSMVVLSLFNEHQRLTADEVQQITQIPREQLYRNLQSLSVAPKTRLLKKEPMSREVSDTDVFSVNEDFHSQFLKIKIALVTDSGNKVENAQQQRESQKKIDEARGALIDAAIVRIMKARKSLPHTTLMNETITILSSRFPPDVALIKKRIETLIEREYLERGNDLANPSYNYLA